MEMTLGQQYNNVVEKPPVILYAYINCHAGTQENTVKIEQCSTPSHMVAIIYYYMGYKYCTKSLYSILKRNQNALRLCEHPPVRGGEMSRRLGGSKGCKNKTSS